MKTKRYIYRHVCPNGKSYIGQTVNTKNRWGKKGNEYKHDILFWNAIQKYGWNNIRHEILEVGYFTKEIANEKEIFWIAFYHTYIKDPLCNGYNLTKGGDNRENKGRPLYQIIFDKVKRKYIIINMFASSKEASRQTGICSSRISAVCLRRKKATSTQGFYFCFVEDWHPNWKPREKKSSKHLTNSIFQIDIKTLKPIKEFESGREIERTLGICGSSVLKCCKRRKNFIKCGGYYWCYVKDYNSNWKPREKIKIINNKPKKIICYTDNTIFDSIRQCFLFIGDKNSNKLKKSIQEKALYKGKLYGYL